MGLEALRAEIHQEAEKGRKNRLDAAKAEAADLVKKAEIEADVLLEQAKNRAQDEAKSLQSRLSAARLEGKKILAEAKDALVAYELASARKSVLSFVSDKRYPSWLKKSVEAGLNQMGKGAKVRVRKKDLPLLKKWGMDAEETDCAGGCIVTSPDGRIRVNATLDSVFESRIETLRQRIFEEI